MVVLSTLEVRWFLDEPPDARAWDAWFQGAASEGEREDRYFLTDSEGLGIKVRASGDVNPKLETKYLLGSLGVTQLHDRFAGCVERWRKLTTTLGDGHDEHDGAWLAITKRRKVRKLAYEGGHVKEVDPKALPSAGCTLEQTELVYAIGAEKKRTLTIGLEAFGPETVLVDVLLRASAHVFDRAPPNIRLGARDSASYPAWLVRVTSVLRSAP